MCRKQPPRNQYRNINYYVIENGIFRIFMAFSLIAMVISQLYTIIDLLYYAQLELIEMSVKPAVLLSFEIVAQAGALNAQDSFSSSLIQLQIGQHYLQKLFDETSNLQGQSNSFQSYLSLHQDETQQSWEELSLGQTQVFYTGPDVSAENFETKRTDDHRRDEDLCAGFRFMLKDFLFNSLQVDGTYIGFDSGGFCYSPSVNKPYFKSLVTQENWKCDKSQTGFYSPLCRGWYRLQENHPNKLTMGDLYRYATGNQFGLTFCSPIYRNNLFAAALCNDIKITQQPIQFLSTETAAEESRKLQSQPLILQRGKQQFLQFLEVVALGFVSEEGKDNFDFSKGWEEEEPFVSSLYNNVEIKTGKFLVPSYVDQIQIDSFYDDSGDQVDNNKRIFYLYSNMDQFTQKPDINSNSYEYYLFFADDQIVDVIFALEEDLKQAIYTQWLPFFTLWSGIYMFFCYLIIRYVSRQLVRPIKVLTNLIDKTVKSVRKLRQSQELHHFELEKHDTMYRNLQIDLLRDYSKQNHETNILYFEFQQKAKILYLANAVSSQRNFRDPQELSSSLFSIMEAVHFFQKQKNWRGAGTCFMVLGCMFASQTEDLTVHSRQSFSNAIKYICQAEKIQRELINEETRERNNVRSRFWQIDQDQILEDQFILAFRLYTHGIISSNYFFMNYQQTAIKQIFKGVQEQADIDQINVRKSLQNFDSKGQHNPFDMSNNFSNSLELPKGRIVRSNSMALRKKMTQCQQYSQNVQMRVHKISDALENLEKCLLTMPTAELVQHENDNSALLHSHFHRRQRSYHQPSFNDHMGQQVARHSSDMRQSSTRPRKIQEVNPFHPPQQSFQDGLVTFNDQSASQSYIQALRAPDQDLQEEKFQGYIQKEVLQETQLEQFPSNTKLLRRQSISMPIRSLYGDAGQQQQLDSQPSAETISIDGEGNNVEQQHMRQESRILWKQRPRIRVMSSDALGPEEETPRQPDSKLTVKSPQAAGPIGQVVVQQTEENLMEFEQSKMQSEHLSSEAEDDQLHREFQLRSPNNDSILKPLTTLRDRESNEMLLDQHYIIQQRTLDGFLDFKIFIRLCILELKLTVFPSLPSIKKLKQRDTFSARSRNQNSFDQLGNQSMARNTWTSDFQFMANAVQQKSNSIQGSPYGRVKLPNLIDFSSIKGLEREQLEAQMKQQVQELEEREVEQLLRYFVCSQELPYDDVDLIVVKRLQAELVDIKSLINELRATGIPQVKRFGLPIFTYDYLVQFYMYVDALNSLNVECLAEIALQKLSQAIIKPKMLCHSIGKKILLCMTEILQSRQQIQKEQLKKDVDKAVPEVFNTVTQLLSNRSKKDRIKDDRGLLEKKRKLRRYHKSLDHLPEQQIRALNSLQTTEKNLIWVKLRLTPHFVHKQALQFILDASFEHSWQYIKCLDFVHSVFKNLNSTDWFGLHTLGDHKYNILLEQKGCNESVKILLLQSLKNTFDDYEYLLQRRGMDIKQALREAMEAMEAVPTYKMNHRNMQFKGPNRWVICLLGSLRGLINLSRVPSDPDINILIVCITDQLLEPEHLRNLKKFVSLTHQGSLMVLRNCYSDELGSEQSQLDLALDRIKSTIQTYPSKRIPIIQEEIRF